MKADGPLDKTGDWVRDVIVVMAIVLSGFWKKLIAREAINCAGRLPACDHLVDWKRHTLMAPQECSTGRPLLQFVLRKYSLSHKMQI